jgi:hypothetical protein
MQPCFIWTRDRRQPAASAVCRNSLQSAGPAEERGLCTLTQKAKPPTCGVPARWRSGYAEDCKSLHAGSIPARASIHISRLRSLVSFGKKWRGSAPFFSSIRLQRRPVRVDQRLILRSVSAAKFRCTVSDHTQCTVRPGVQDPLITKPEISPGAFSSRWYAKLLCHSGQFGSDLIAGWKDHVSTVNAAQHHRFVPGPQPPI